METLGVSRNLHVTALALYTEVAAAAAYQAFRVSPG